MVNTADDGSQTSAVAERTGDVKSPLTPSGIASRLLSTLRPRVRDGSLVLAAGGLFLWRGLRSIRRGRARGVIPAAIGVIALRSGLRKWRSDSSGRETGLVAGVEIGDISSLEWTDDDDDNDAEDKGISDEAYAAARRPETGRPTEEGPTRSTDDEVLDGLDPDESVEPSVDSGLEPSEPSATDLDPRLDEDGEADLSKTARAEEPSEATGPAPEQAQPARSIDGEADPVSGGPSPEAADDDDGGRNGSDEKAESMEQDETDPDASQSAGDDAEDAFDEHDTDK